MNYIVIHETKVTEIIPEMDSRFPGVPIEKRFTPDFLEKCVKVEDDTAVSLGMTYKDGKFTEPEPVPAPPEVIESTTADMLALAIAELAEKIGGASNG